MRESIPEIATAVEAVYALTTGMGRGTVLTHEQIGAVLNLRPHEGRWDHIVGKVRRRLERERGIATWPDPTVGYRLLTPAEQLQVPEWRTKKGMRQLRRGRKSLDALPEKNLSLYQRRARLFMLDRLRETERALRHELKAQRTQLQPTPTIPRRPAFNQG